MADTQISSVANAPQLRRALSLWDLILYGMIVIQPTAPMPVYGVMSQRAHGHAVTTVLIAMVAMLFTAMSYGKMARAYPSAGSAFTYVGSEIHPALGYVTGWSMAMDYMLNPIVCTILCSKFALNFLPEIPYPVFIVFFITLFTCLNLFGIKTSARINETLAAGMGVVIVIFLVAAARYVLKTPHDGFAFFTRPFYDPQTFSMPAVLGGTSLAVLTYIGFDGISTLSEEAENPKRNILLATVLVCLITGVLASIEVYAAQLVWPGAEPFPDVDTAYVSVAGRAAGAWLFALINITLLVATVGSGMGSQLGAARLLFGMGRGNALPKSFFGVIEPKRRIPRNNVLFVGFFALLGTIFLTFERAAELLNFGALLAFMGVNAASFTHYYLRQSEKKWNNLLVPVMGFTVCLLLWLNLSRPAKIAGVIWMAVGIAYGAFRTRGFKSSLVSFDVPEDVDGSAPVVERN
ncbi:MAG TPA: APC family permease [Terriglobales bacterium]|jgi:putrescine importer|nr:APC family permease [Terriglobales bacterium]